MTPSAIVAAALAVIISFNEWATIEAPAYVLSQPPEIEVLDERALWRLVHPRQSFPDDPNDGRILAAVATTGPVPVLYLLTTWGDIPFDRSVVVHEVTHLANLHAGVRFPCLGARETPAYEIQRRWLRSVHDLDLYDFIDPLWAFMERSAGCGQFRVPGPHEGQ